MDESEWLLGPKIATVTVPKNYSYADTIHERILASIASFEARLSPTEEVGAKLAQFGQTVTIAIEHVGFRNPSLIEISGRTIDGSRCTLVQHMSQVNILLVAVTVEDGHKA